MKHTLYLEVINEWTGEIAYHAETVSVALSLDAWVNVIWHHERYQDGVNRVLVAKEIVR